MGRFALFGERLSHSYSPLLHSMIYTELGLDHTYSLIEFELNRLEDYINMIRQGYIKGANITIPYKIKSMNYVDFVNCDAEQIGSINTIYLRDGNVYGVNTDYFGIEKTLKDVKKDGVYLILGYGGAAKTVLTYLKKNGAKKIYIATRDKSKYISEEYMKYGRDIYCDVEFVGYNDISKIKGDVIINTTPVGMSPDYKKNPIGDDTSVYNNFHVAFDLIYNPIETEFLKEAKKNGLYTKDGLKMLVYQGICSCDFFLEENICIEELFGKIYPKILDIINGVKKNISFVGMPGCGKSTIGKIISDNLNFSFVDLDEYIEEVEGMSVSDIFSIYGEDYFRGVEERAIKEVLKKDRVLLSTGGGSILRESNRDFLMKYSLVVYLDRSVEDILSDVQVDKRPLLKGDKNSVKMIYNNRYKLYELVSDIRVKNNSSIDKISNLLIDILKIYKSK